MSRGHIGNERADELAKRGCWEANTNDFYIRKPLEFDWKQEEFVDNVNAANVMKLSLLGITTQNKRRTKTIEIDKNEEPLRSTNGSTITPLQEITKAIVSTATRMGKA